MTFQSGRFAHLDRRLILFMARSGISLLRISIGIVFLWFGALKFFPGLSPAEDLATRTISLLSGGLIPIPFILPFLAAWECAIGIGLLIGRGLRITLLLLFLQMGGTMMPILLFPGEVFKSFPLVPTLEGQYIIKNVVLMSAGLVIGATVRGGRLVVDPKAAPRA